MVINFSGSSCCSPPPNRVLSVAVLVVLLLDRISRLLILCYLNGCICIIIIIQFRVSSTRWRREWSNGLLITKMSTTRPERRKSLARSSHLITFLTEWRHYILFRSISIRPWFNPVAFFVSLFAGMSLNSSSLPRHCALIVFASTTCATRKSLVLLIYLPPLLTSTASLSHSSLKCVSFNDDGN